MCESECYASTSHITNPVGRWHGRRPEELSVIPHHNYRDHQTAIRTVETSNIASD